MKLVTPSQPVTYITTTFAGPQRERGWIGECVPVTISKSGCTWTTTSLIIIVRVWSMVHVTCYTLHGPHYTLHATRYMVHITRYTLHGPCYTVHGPVTCYTLHAACYTVHVTRSTVHVTWSTLHGTCYTVHVTRFMLQSTHLSIFRYLTTSRKMSQILNFVLSSVGTSFTNMI